MLRIAQDFRELDWLIQTIQIHTAAMLGAALRALVRRTVHWRCRSSGRGSGRRAGYNNDGTCGEHQDRPSYKLHSCCFSRGLETSCCGRVRRRWRTEASRLSYKLHSGGSGGSLETLRGGDVARRHWMRTGACGHQGSPQQESWTSGGAARAQTWRAGVYALLDCDNRPGSSTRLLRQE
jgi:hypothetical protein